MEGQWCTIESDPSTFTELAKKLGIKGVQFEECIDLECFDPDCPVYGYVFLFKWDKPTDSIPTDTSTNDLFFIKQNVTNACATIAILNIAFNTPSIQLDEKLKEFRDFISELPPDIRGLALTNSHDIRSAHNSFITLESINADLDDKKSKESDAFHFVAILPKDSVIYELDGMKESVNPIGSYADGQDTTEVLRIVKKIMSESDELRFALLAMVPDRIEYLQKQLDECAEDAKHDLEFRVAKEIEQRSMIAQAQEIQKAKLSSHQQTIPTSSTLTQSEHENLQLALGLMQKLFAQNRAN